MGQLYSQISFELIGLKMDHRLFIKLKTNEFNLTHKILENGILKVILV